MADATSIVLRHMCAPGERAVYVLGSFERRITLYSQQVRALNLVYALTAAGHLAAGQHVAVIGGGAAGLTAAAALLHLGLNITLLEKQPELLPLQWGCEKRFVHPHIYDWPAPGSLAAEARLPVLSWTAGTAASVADQLRRAWDDLVAVRVDRVRVLTSIERVTLLPADRDARRRLSWNPGNHYGDFDSVIVAVGFGVEKTITPVPAHSYWRDDRLAQDDLAPARRYLISGTGDGGLTDFLRATIRRFRHGEMVPDFDLDPERGADARRLADRLQTIEAEARCIESEDDAAAHVTLAYKELGPLSGFVDARLRDRLTGRKVTLHGPGHYPLSLQASVLNRYLTSRVIEVGNVTCWSGPLIEDSLARAGAAWRVTVDGNVGKFDEVVLRHGTEPAFDTCFPSLTTHDKDLYATLRVSEAMLGDEPLLRDVLDVLTVSGSASMSTSLLAALLDVSEMALIGPLSLAVKLRLLGTEDDPSSGGSQRYRIHRLVQEVRRDEIAIEQRTAWAQDVSRRLAAWFEHRREDFADMPAFEAEIDHLRAWQRYALDGGWPVRARLTWLQGYPHYHRGRYREAHDWLEAAERYHRESPAGDDLDALLADDMGQLELVLGNHNGALAYYQRALELRRQRCGDNHADTALSLRNVAGAYRAFGDYKQALELGEQALAMLHVVHGPRHRDIASVSNELGVTHAELGDYRKALDFQSRALQLDQELLGAFYPGLAPLLNNLGNTYGHLGDDQAALVLQGQALEIEQKAFGDEHPKTATSRSNLGLTYLRLGEHQLAKEHAEGALKTRREMLGDDHPATGLSLSNVAGVYTALGDHAKALALKEEALRVHTRAFGETHPNTATALNNLGGTYNDLGDHENALVLAQRFARHPT